MTPLIQQLLLALKGRQPAPGETIQVIRDFLRAQAASVILQDPSQAQIPAGDFDPLVVEAIQAGAAQAAALKEAGGRLRVFQTLPVGFGDVEPAERPSEVVGLMAVNPGFPARQMVFQSSPFLSVTLRLPGPEGGLWLLIPATSQPDAPDNRTWTLPAGTVWIRSQFLAAGASGFAGVRIAGGTLQFNVPVALLDKAIAAPQGAIGTLSIQPEQPAAGAAKGSDAEAFNLRLPAQLEVHSNAPPLLTGDAELSGFGSSLHFTPSGPAVVEGSQICFSLQADEPLWSIQGNRSRVAQFSGESEPGRPRYAIPISSTLPVQLGQANHGGSIVLSLRDGLTSTFATQGGGPSRWFAATLTVNDARIDIESLQAVSDARYDLSLWTTALSELRFAQQPIGRMIFRSERGGMDSAAVLGGACTNKWDLPRQANGSPFAFDGTIANFVLIATPANLLLTLFATAPITKELSGLAFENLYFPVRPPRQLYLIAKFETAPLLPSGNAALMFDVSAAVPTLPDPYAANLAAFDPNVTTEMALRIALKWDASATPAVSAHLDRVVRFPPAINLPILQDPDEQEIYAEFQSHLSSHQESIRLLDLSSREHLFGVAFETDDNKPELVDNRLALRLSSMRLLMQPQVQWEPVQIVPNDPNVAGLKDEIAHSTINAGPTLIGANSVKLISVLPGPLSHEIIEAIGARSAAAALFSLPFGLRAMADLDLKRVSDHDGPIIFFPPATLTSIHEPAFDKLTSARQLRLSARIKASLTEEPSRVMPGAMRQLGNLAGNLAGPKSVLPQELRQSLNAHFARGVPLHQADLSGYGLTTFSEWHQDVKGAGFSKIEFRVLNGRTAYEVIQFRSILYECGARTVRTVILERFKTGRVFRMDTGWVAIDAGVFARPKPFEKGAVKSFKNIRRIRIVGDVFKLDPTASMQPVLFDADAEIEGVPGGSVPIYDRPGYVLITPEVPPIVVGNIPLAIEELSELQLTALFHRVHAIGSPVDCAIRIADTLNAQISSIVSDVALSDNDGIGFAVAVVGAPKLPRAGQWSVVRIDPVTHDTLAVDQRRGVPIVREGAGPFRFREPADTRRSKARVEYALLMCTDSSRALFKQAKIDPAPGQRGKISFEVPPLLADPYSLMQSTGLFPRPDSALRMNETAAFQITPDDVWRIENGAFTLDGTPLDRLMQGGGWGIARKYVNKTVVLDIDSALAAPFNVNAPASILNLDLPDPFGEILKIRATYENVAGGVPKLLSPDVIFGGALDALTETLDSLANLLNLPFHVDVSVTAGSGASPSFVVHLSLLFRIGDGPEGRVEIGLGKFYGQFLVRGELETALTGVDRALLFIEFQGDVQQGILPPLLYAGGLMRFSLELRETGPPLIQLTLGIVTSLGGDLIPGLLAVEATIKYGYSLIPETLEPGILLGIEARAKLLAGLIGFSFAVEAMARIRRIEHGQVVRITAQIHVAASVQVAIFFEEDVDFETQFEQDIPLATFGLIPGVGVLFAPALIPL